jgi:hypothetical protein
VPVAHIFTLRRAPSTRRTGALLMQCINKSYLSSYLLSSVYSLTSKTSGAAAEPASAETHRAVGCLLSGLFRGQVTDACSERITSRITNRLLILYVRVRMRFEYHICRCMKGSMCVVGFYDRVHTLMSMSCRYRLNHAILMIQ